VPEEALYKSTMWFSLEAWLAVEGLAERVDFVLLASGWAKVLAREAAKPGSDFHARLAVLYLDDAVYSGQQVGQLLAPAVDVDFFLVAAAITSQGRRYIDVVCPMSVDIHASEAVVPARRSLLENLQRTADPVKVAAWREWALDAVRPLFSDHDMFTPDYIGTPDVLWAQFAFKADLPALVCEHKLADAASINTFVLVNSFMWRNKREVMRSFFSLIHIGGTPLRQPLYSGSQAFYKALEWHYKGKPRESMPLGPSFASYMAAPLACATCAQPLAPLVCAQCQLAAWCNRACMNEGKHAQMCVFILK